MKFLKTLLTLALLFSSATIFAAETYCATGSCTQQPCVQCELKKACSSEWVIQKEKKSCYYTECKDICIPKVRFPWEKRCKPKCGKVITVKILRKKKYACEKCTTKWNIFSYGGGCTDNSCTTCPSERRTVLDTQLPASAFESPTPPPAPAIVVPKK